MPCNLCHFVCGLCMNHVMLYICTAIVGAEARVTDLYVGALSKGGCKRARGGRLHWIVFVTHDCVNIH